MSTTDRVLITGASGFLGAAIADAARQRGLSVRALVRSSSPKANLHPADAIATGDLLDVSSLERALRDVRFVIHAAADYRLWSRTPEALVATNVEGTRNLIDNFPAFAKAKILEQWGGLIDVTPDAVPVISQVPSIPGFMIASGFSGHGFGIGPGAGRLVADLVTGDSPIVDPAPYRLERFARLAASKPTLRQVA